MVQIILDNIKLGKNMEKGNSNGQMGAILKEILPIIISKEMEYMYGVMGGNIRVNGKIIKWTG